MTKCSSLFVSGLMVSLLFSCSGGGLSDGFTREINEVETAWKNASGSFTASLDSVDQATKEWAAMTVNMQVPDSMQSRLTPEYKARLDSVKQICIKQGESYEMLHKEMETARNNWDQDSKVFASWKDKVFKSEIDIETARKDLKDYQAKVKSTTDISNKTASRLNQIRQNCEANHKIYDSLVTAIPKEEVEQPRRRHRRGGHS